MKYTDTDKQLFNERIKSLMESTAMDEIGELVATFNESNKLDLFATTATSTAAGLLLFVKGGILEREPDTQHRLTPKQIELASSLALSVGKLSGFPFSSNPNGDYLGTKAITYQFYPSLQ